MKISKVLSICFVVLCLFTGNALAQCSVQLDDALSPNNGIYQVGDTINYEITLAIPPNGTTTYCSLENFTVEFLNPTTAGTSACDDASRVLLYSDASFDPGESITITGPGMGGDVTNAAMSYVIQEADLIDGTFNKVIVARVCSSWDGALGRDTDEKSLINNVLNPEVCVTKSVECDISSPGYFVDYKIRIENCGDTELQLQSIVDTLASPLLSNPNLYELALLSGCEFLDPVGEGWDDPNSCVIMYALEVLEGDLVPDPNLVNEVTAVYEAIGTGQTVEDSDDVVVDLIDPDFTVEKICLDEPLMVGEDANFLITIENTGTVDLILESDEITIEPNLLVPNEIYMTNVLQPVETCEDASNTVFVSAILPPDICFQLDEPILRDASASCEVIDPDFTVEKTCLSDPVPVDANAIFEIVITNTSCGDVDLYFDVNDPAAALLLEDIGPIPPLGEERIPIELPADCELDEIIMNTVYVEAFYDSMSIGTKEATAECPVTPCGLEGCTPGYWKNSPDCWCEAYYPTMTLDQVFDFDQVGIKDSILELRGKTLMEALKFKGGASKKQKMRILLRHAVAALLNGCNENVDYPVSESYVIDAVDEKLVSLTQILQLKDELQDYNQLGCPISADNSKNPCSRSD